MAILSHIEYLEKQNKAGRLQYIKDYLQKIAVEFIVEPYDTGKNLYLQLGKDKPKRMAIASHYDTVPNSPGANDNGSAIAICLEITAWYAQNPLNNLGLDIFFFDEEERYMRGSKAFWANREPSPDLLGLYNLEMVGQGSRFALWNLNEHSQGIALQAFEDTCAQSGIPCQRFDQIITNYADHQSFKEAGVSEAFSITCISEQDLLVAQQYYLALAKGANISELQSLMQTAPLFAHYHSPSDQSIYLEEDALQMTLRTLQQSLRHLDNKL